MAMTEETARFLCKEERKAYKRQNLTCSKGTGTTSTFLRVEEGCAIFQGPKGEFRKSLQKAISDGDVVYCYVAKGYFAT
ncbi:MAG: hypothetical protein ACJKSS_02160 [Patescibacteria group bacterium UBA2103]